MICDKLFTTLDIQISRNSTMEAFSLENGLFDIIATIISNSTLNVLNRGER